MRKIISHMHVSLDGFAAGKKGEMDWIKHGFIWAGDLATDGWILVNSGQQTKCHQA